MEDTPMSGPDDYYIAADGQACSNAHDAGEASQVFEGTAGGDNIPTNGNCGQDADNVSDGK